MINNPDPSLPFQNSDELILIGTDVAEEKLFTRYAQTIKIKA